MEFDVTVLVAGEASGEVLRLGEPLSFWGGVDPATGQIIDVHHPQLGQSMTGTILVMDHGRGSSSSSQVLAEAIRLGKGPVGIILSDSDPILMLGALVAGMMYGRQCPVVVAGPAEFELIDDGMSAAISAERVSLLDG